MHGSPGCMPLSSRPHRPHAACVTQAPVAHPSTTCRSAAGSRRRRRCWRPARCPRLRPGQACCCGQSPGAGCLQVRVSGVAPTLWPLGPHTGRPGVSKRCAWFAYGGSLHILLVSAGCLIAKNRTWAQPRHHDCVGRMQISCLTCGACPWLGVFALKGQSPCGARIWSRTPNPLACRNWVAALSLSRTTQGPLCWPGAD